MKSLRNWKVDPFLAVIVLLGGFLRMFRPGLPPVLYDEINVLFWSHRIVESGAWIWTSNNPMSAGSNFTPFTHHSPLTNYVFLLPNLISDDPGLSRLLVGLLGTVAAGLLFVIARRAFGRPTAIMAGLAYAVSPMAVEWARFAWNPSIAPLIVIGWIGTTLFGYRDEIRWLRWLSWVLLALMIQAHPANVVFSLPALVAVVGPWATVRSKRKHVVDTLLGGVFASFTFLPWVYGTFVDAGPIQPVSVSPTASTPAIDTVALWFEQFARLTSATSYRTIARGSDTLAQGNWWPDQRLDVLLTLFALAAALLLAFVTFHSLRNVRARWPALFVASIGFAPLIAANLIARVAVEDFYLLAILPGVYLGTGIALSWVIARWKRLQPMVIASVAVFVLLQTWLTASMLRGFDLDGWEESLRAPLETFRASIAAWVEPTGDALFVVDAFDHKYQVWDAQRYLWSVLGDGLPLRVIDRVGAPEGIPIGPEGTTLVSLAEGTTIESLFGPVTGEGATEDGIAPVFVRRTVYPADLPAPNLVPSGPATFSNGAHLLGAALEEEANTEAWTGVLLWTPVELTDQQYQFSLRVVGADGATYGQQDFTSLRPEAWRIGDVVVSPFSLALRPEAVGQDALRLQVLMYSLPDIRNAQVLDDEGHAVGEWIYLESAGTAPTDAGP